MRRLVIFVCLLGLVGIAAGTSSVLAGSSRTTVTYWSDAIAASSFQASVNPVAKTDQPPGTWYWLGYGGTATWTFDVAAIPALNGTVALNFAGLSTSLQPSGGAGFDTMMRINVTGVGSTTSTATLNNPWQPHVAYNYAPPSGWQGSASVVVPDSVWRGASVLKVKVTSMTTNTYMGVNTDALMVGFASTA